MTSVGSCCLLFERLFRKLVGNLVQEGLFDRLSSSQGVEVDISVRQMNLGSDEPMNPVPVDQELMAEQAGLSAVVGTADIDQSSLRMLLQIQLPAFRKRSPRGSRFGSGCHLLPGGSKVLVGTASLGARRLSCSAGVVRSALVFAGRRS